MPPPNRNRIVYGFLTISIMLLGLASRRFLGDIAFVKDYVGDVLWALMVFFGLACLLKQWSTKAISLTTFLFSLSIEISQLYHAPWIDSLRAIRLGGLLLGFTFIWSDLLCYSIGLMVGLLAEFYLIPTAYQTRPKTRPA